ncbi:MAG: DNA methyltransferase [Candidatus Micrarchaeota archaeon]|nr:DNA methyltransferase [Candidatus Micrarchaeota archaeon]
MKNQTLESYSAGQAVLQIQQTESWDFEFADTQCNTHGMHNYPARMVPQIAERLIKKYSQPGQLIYDPMCGSGTALVEAMLCGRRAIGTDLNPLAILLSKVKTTPIESNYLKNRVSDFLEKLNSRFNQLDGVNKRKSLSKPDFTNIDFWFKPQVIVELAIIRELIFNVGDKTVQEFLLVPFSATVRKVSNTRPGEFKLYRYSPTLLEKHNPNVLKIFKEELRNSMVCLMDFNRATGLKCDCNAYKVDARYTENIIPNGSVDLIVTSPPYGDSRTTVAYGQFSRLSLQWLGLDYDEIRSYDEITRLDKASLGGSIRKNYVHSLKSKSLDSVLKTIAAKDAQRAEEVAWFFVDLNDVYKQMHRVLRKGGIAGIVIGNRTVKETLIPSSTITSELCGELGFEPIEKIDRNIPYKTIPLLNSPTNETGVIGRTMNKEDIVVLRKY